MNIDNLTIGEARQIAALFGNGGAEPTFTPHIGKRCIIRTYASGEVSICPIYHGRELTESITPIEPI